jgi:outer membrane protein assembly factor BamB
VTAGNLIFAHSKGRVHALEMETGRLLWTNPLLGLGYGLATLSIPGGMSSPTPAVIQHLLQQQNSGAAGSTGATGAT